MAEESKDVSLGLAQRGQARRVSSEASRGGGVGDLGNSNNKVQLQPFASGEKAESRWNAEKIVAMKSVRQLQYYRRHQSVHFAGWWIPFHNNRPQPHSDPVSKDPQFMWEGHIWGSTPLVFRAVGQTFVLDPREPP